MLETVLRAGVLGEDDTGEESPKNLKVPSRRPSVVCENCLYSLHKDMRARAFHIMDPHGILQMLLVFLEERGDEVPDLSSSCSIEDISTRITPLLGRWQGHSLTKRSGVYGATIAEADTIALLELNDRGQLIQDITSTSANGTTTNVHWTGTVSNNLVILMVVSNSHCYLEGCTWDAHPTSPTAWHNRSPSISSSVGWNHPTRGRGSFVPTTWRVWQCHRRTSSRPNYEIGTLQI
ncbi:uncharacterized protein M6B38_114505 [Iris pallida]|uniref:Uncharacterized protein n=1 Tax=Iris pallida TaxID=29817 RepID=A0AAX6ICQ8_IRIPA|nr:uncharacterized protein M6B38_114505 [Iris pallida]